MQVSIPTEYIPLVSLILKENLQIPTTRLMMPEFNGFMTA